MIRWLARDASAPTCFCRRFQKLRSCVHFAGRQTYVFVESITYTYIVIDRYVYIVHTSIHSVYIYMYICIHTYVHIMHDGPKIPLKSRVERISSEVLAPGAGLQQKAATLPRSLTDIEAVSKIAHEAPACLHVCI